MTYDVRETPSLQIISRPSLDVDAFEKYLAGEGLAWARTPGATEAEELVELAGRLCYMSFGERQSPRTNAQYIWNLLQQGHESVLEHVEWTFLLTGVSRSFSHQFARHRVGFALSQLSQQYTDPNDAPTVIPELVRASKTLTQIWERAIIEAKKAYEVIQRELQASIPEPDDRVAKRERRRAIRSAARSVLPEATETRIVFTANARAIRHFLTLRGSIAGDLEMRLVSAELLAIVEGEAPALFADFEIVQLDGEPLVKRIHLDERE